MSFDVFVKTYTKYVSIKTNIRPTENKTICYLFILVSFILSRLSFRLLFRLEIKFERVNLK